MKKWHRRWRYRRPAPMPAAAVKPPGETSLVVDAPPGDTLLPVVVAPLPVVVTPSVVVAPREFEDIEARAARLGITEDRVLREYGRIAFANLKHFLVAGETGTELRVSEDTAEDDFAAVAELIEGAKDHKPYRIKLYDKRPALDAIARYLRMAPKTTEIENEPDDDDGEDSREFLKRTLARIAARTAKK